jgi:GntR family transcriptional regulator
MTSEQTTAQNSVEVPQLPVRRSSAVPYYEQLKIALVQQMEGGLLHVGDMLPSETELCRQFRVSRTVVRQALGDLVSEGRVYRMRGKGTFVARPPLRAQFLESSADFFEDVLPSDEQVTRTVRSLDLRPAPRVAAQALGLRANAFCLEIERLRSVGGEVAAYTKHFLPLDLRADLLADVRSFDVGNHSIYEFLEEVCDIRIDSGHRSLEAIPAPPEVATLLGTEIGAPLLYVVSVEREITGKPVQFFEAWHRGDRTKFDMDVRGRTRSRPPE